MPLAAEDQPVDSTMSQPPTAEEIPRMKTKASTTNGGASPPPPAAKRARTGKTETKDDQTKTNDDQTTPPVQVLTNPSDATIPPPGRDPVVVGIFSQHEIFSC